MKIKNSLPINSTLSSNVVSSAQGTPPIKKTLTHFLPATGLTCIIVKVGCKLLVKFANGHNHIGHSPGATTYLNHEIKLW